MTYLGDGLLCTLFNYAGRVKTKMSPLTKYNTIAPNLAINEIRLKHIDPDVHADPRYITGIDRSRNV